MSNHFHNNYILEYEAIFRHGAENEDIKRQLYTTFMNYELTMMFATTCMDFDILITANI